MRQILYEVETHDELPQIVSGGGWWCMRLEDPEMTQERYERELKAWCREERARRVERSAPSAKGG